MFSHFAHCAVPCERGLKLTPVKGELRVFGFGRGVEVRLTFPPRINARETEKEKKKKHHVGEIMNG
jgi:hypothetical protein